MPKQLSDIFKANESPYFGMYTAGRNGFSLADTVNYVRMLGIPIREKDIKAWEDGNFKHEMYSDNKSILNPVINNQALIINQNYMPAFNSLPKLPNEWNGTERRFFPCTQDNKPMRKWGWSKDFTPDLLSYTNAKQLSPCGWIGQNMLYQPFIVLDIDGVGHGCIDESVIQFGTMFKDKTLTYENPAKPGSFHLYLRTDRLVPVKHFPWAKIDLMGNAVNAAVYFKDKQPNNIRMMDLTEEIWNMLDAYQKIRKETI